ncbi:MAG: hypothetical protein CMJ47_02745 [Planctomyces sp.]|nr:hypothetical protein [Planctomyces sp.]
MRIADTIVWDGENGRQVIASLEGLTESQNRITGAIQGLESSQLAAASTLQTVQNVSMASFGVLSLTAGLMMWRLHSLDKRLKLLSKQVSDVTTRLDANDKARLETSLKYLDLFEQKHRGRDLETAHQEAAHSANTYGNLIDSEVGSDRRLSLMNYWGRCYLLSLLTELSAMIYQDDLQQAVDRADSQRNRIQEYVSATYQQTIAKAPEMYLDPNLSEDGVNLTLMTEVYGQLRVSHAIDNADIRDSNELFELLREPIYRTRKKFKNFWIPVGAAKTRYLKNLKYLIACVEDANRIESVKLRIQSAIDNAYSLVDLRDQIKAERDKIQDVDKQTIAFLIPSHESISKNNVPRFA